jgi:bacteriorhodopsin
MLDISIGMCSSRLTESKTNGHRFIGWTPLIIAIGLISGVSWATIVYNVALSWAWVATWLSGALVATHYKWGFFAFGTFAYILLAASLLHRGGLAARRVGVSSHHWIITGWLVFIWLLYSIAYGVDDGGNKIGVTQGWIFFGILDVLTVPLLSFFILALSRRWDYRSLNLYFTQYGRVAQAGEFPEREKTAGAPATGVIQPESSV